LIEKGHTALGKRINAKIKLVLLLLPQLKLLKNVRNSYQIVFLLMGQDVLKSQIVVVVLLQHCASVIRKINSVGLIVLPIFVLNGSVKKPLYIINH
jgi:hypothetical protein